MTTTQLANFPGFYGVRFGSKNGGEYHGKCPGNGPDCVDLDRNNDRMRVWPLQGQTGRWNCRKCGRSGDAIQWLRDFEGLGYVDACARLGVTPKSKTMASVPGRASSSRPAPAPLRRLTIHPVSSPSSLWIEQAEKFVTWCHQQLLANQEQLAYLAGRGITLEAVIACRLGWNPSDTYRDRQSWGLPVEISATTNKPKRIWLPAGIVIPVYRAGVLQRVRIRRPKWAREKSLPGRKYQVVDGSVSTTMILGVAAPAYAVVEAELDAIAIFAAAADLVGAVSIESLENNIDAGAHALFQQAIAILNALDADDPKSAALQRACAKWANTYQRQIRWPVPTGKDPGEAFKAGVDLRTWIIAGLPPFFSVGHGRVEPPGPSAVSGLVRGAAENEETVATAEEPEAEPVDGAQGEEMSSSAVRGVAADGREYLVVETKEQWEAAVAAGQLVLSRGEVERLHAACLACADPDGASAMATAVLDVKEVFPGAYVERGGKAVHQFPEEVWNE